MKKQIVSLLFLIYSMCAQGAGDVVYLRVYQPERENLTPAACRLLETKLTQMLSIEGLSNNSPNNRLIFTAKAHLLQKNIVAGIPNRITVKIDLTLIIGDAIDNMVFGTHAFPLVGVGLNEDSAILQAIKTVKTEDESIARYLKQVKKRITDYYREQEPLLLKHADVLAGQGRYDEAITYLASVPNAYKPCYDHCQNKMIALYQNQTNEEGLKLLTQAKAAWYKGLDSTAANEAYSLVSAIKPTASCYSEVGSLIRQIGDKLSDDQQKEWAFQQKQYEDELAREQRAFDAQQKREKREAAIRKQEIEAARQVAVEYAKHQPETINNTILLW